MTTTAKTTKATTGIVARVIFVARDTHGISSSRLELAQMNDKSTPNYGSEPNTEGRSQREA